MEEQMPGRGIPDDLLREILSFLPVKSLVRFRTVNPPWRTLIGDADFIRLNMSRSPNNRHESHFLAVQFDNDRPRPIECSLRQSRDFGTTPRIGSSRLATFEETFCIYGSMDGLVILVQSDTSVRTSTRRLALWNASIRKILLVNPSHASLNYLVEFGLGFDPVAKDYKYVRFGADFTEVYTVSNDLWRTVPHRNFPVSYDSIQNAIGKTVCYRGHLVAPASVGKQKQRKMFVLIFDLQCHTYSSLAWPEVTNPRDTIGRADGFTLAEGGSSLQLVSVHSGKGSVWVLEGDLRQDLNACNWVIRYAFDVTRTMGRSIARVSWRDRFLCMNEQAVVFFQGASSAVISVDLVTHEENHTEDEVFQTWPYKESLLLIDCEGRGDASTGNQPILEL